jgi:hypothetical protein
MSSRVTVIEVLKSEEQKGRGTFDFLELPRLHERIILGSPIGDMEIHEVRNIEHRPTMAKPETIVARMAAEEGPKVTVFIKLVGRYP